MIPTDKPKLRIFSGDGGGGGGRSRLLLPGARKDWEVQAGVLYLNDAVSMACNRLGDMFAMCPLILKERQPDGKWMLVEDHPLTELWERNNDDYDNTTRDIVLAMSLVTAGDAFLYVERDESYGDPIGLYWLDERYVDPIYPYDGSKYLTSWRYQVQGGHYVDIPPSDVLHFRRGIDPLNTRRGLSPLKALLRKICLLNSSDGYSVSLLSNMGIPGLVVSPAEANDTIEDSDAAAIKWSLDRQTKGEAAGTSVVLSRRVQLDTMGISPEKLALDKLPAGAAHAIYAACGLSAEALGVPTATKTYTNYETAIKAAWTFGAMPALALMRSTIRRVLFPEFGLDPKKYWLEHDFSGIPELQKSEKERHDMAAAAWTANAITLDEFREETNRQPDPEFGHLYKWEMEAGGMRDQANAESEAVI